MNEQAMPRRHPRGVYIRRRIAVLAALVTLIVVIVMMIAGPDRVAGWFGAGESTTKSTQPEKPTGSTNSAPSETATPETPAAVTACVPSVIAVEAVTDSTDYGADQLPKFSLRVTNHGEVECDIDLGTKTMAFTVRSGQEQYWDSRDCQENPESFEVRMQPGQTIESGELEWQRTRSHPEACDADQDRVPAGGASYHLEVEVGGVKSLKSKQFILY